MAPFFVAALIYSKSPTLCLKEKNLLDEIIKKIKADPVLKEGLHLINIDNNFSRDLLTHNTTNNKINIWPIFLIRKSQEEEAQQYQLRESETVFKEVKKYHKKFNSIV